MPRLCAAEGVGSAAQSDDERCIPMRASESLANPRRGTGARGEAARRPRAQNTSRSRRGWTFSSDRHRRALSQHPVTLRSMNGWMIVGLSLLCLVLMTAAPPAASASQRVAARSTRTVTTNVRPVDAKGALNPGYSVRTTQNGGDCWTESIDVSDAYRCAAGNYISDPCWAESGGDLRVVCLAAPWDHRVLRMNLAFALPKLSSFASPAWGIELTSGNQCVFLTGATGAVDGERINYGCTKNNVVLTGRVGRRHEPWRIQTAVLDGTQYVRGKVEPVKVVWHALPAVYR
jgi:hypothetical protein